MIYSLKFLTWTSFFTTHLGSDFRDWGELSKNYLRAFCPHIDCVTMKNLESIALMVSEKRTVNTTDRRTDGRTWLDRFFSRWSGICILYRVWHVSFDLLHTFCLTNTPFFLFLRESGLKKYIFSIYDFYSNYLACLHYFNVRITRMTKFI